MSDNGGNVAEDSRYDTGNVIFFPGDRWIRGPLSIEEIRRRMSIQEYLQRFLPAQLRYQAKLMAEGSNIPEDYCLGVVRQKWQEERRKRVRLEPDPDPRN